jgi:hypothetical protein
MNTTITFKVEIPAIGKSHFDLRNATASVARGLKIIDELSGKFDYNKLQSDIQALGCNPGSVEIAAHIDNVHISITEEAEVMQEIIDSLPTGFSVI